jgi:hypothetical protein
MRLPLEVVALASCVLVNAKAPLETDAYLTYKTE